MVFQSLRVANVSLVSPTLFSSPASSFMTVVLNSCSDIMLLSVLRKSLAMFFYISFGENSSVFSFHLGFCLLRVMKVCHVLCSQE